MQKMECNMYNDKVVKRDDLLSRKVRRLQVRQTKRNRQRERETKTKGRRGA